MSSTVVKDVKDSKQITEESLKPKQTKEPFNIESTSSIIPTATLPSCVVTMNSTYQSKKDGKFVNQVFFIYKNPDGRAENVTVNLSPGLQPPEEFKKYDMLFECSTFLSQGKFGPQFNIIPRKLLKYKLKA